MRFRIFIPAAIVGLWLGMSGCVVVHPTNVSLTGIGSPASRHPDEPVTETPYADALRKVERQQHRVAHELEKGDWKELADEAGDWLEYTRELLGYANSSHDPARFRKYTTQLLAHVRRFRSAAYERNAEACRRALAACDPILDDFFRDFPLTTDRRRLRPARVTEQPGTHPDTTTDKRARVP